MIGKQQISIRVTSIPNHPSDVYEGGVVDLLVSAPLSYGGGRGSRFNGIGSSLIWTRKGSQIPWILPLIKGEVVADPLMSPITWMRKMLQIHCYLIANHIEYKGVADTLVSNTLSYE